MDSINTRTLYECENMAFVPVSVPIVRFPGSLGLVIEGRTRHTALWWPAHLSTPRAPRAVKDVYKRQGQASRIQAGEMRFDRHVARYTFHDHRRDTDIRQELNIMSILDRIA